MSPRSFQFDLLATDTDTQARRGRLQTPHGAVETPAFMPVGTRATIKGLTPDLVWDTGSRMILANTYHLALRPGEETVNALGGLHRFMAWPGPILTDSGGFQVFSLAANAAITDDAVHFRSHIDGSALQLSPERAIAIQNALGADVIMCLDHCPALPAEKNTVAQAVNRTVHWAKRCRNAHNRDDQSLWAIAQGATHADLRAECVDRLIEIGFEGYAIGGVSVGESPDQIAEALAITTHRLPHAAPRYLMGVGHPRDILRAVATGVDLFDCVMPTRNGRNATCFTQFGLVKLRNATHRVDNRPIEPECDCLACRKFSRGYIRHLFLVDEMLGPILASIHNLAYLQRLMSRIRAAIEAGDFASFIAQSLEVNGGATID
jgi:queuine tRNA-ribosyltransferase